MEPIPAYVETAIYGYFLLVGALGCYLHGRLWIGSRSENGEPGSETGGELPSGPN